MMRPLPATARLLVLAGVIVASGCASTNLPSDDEAHAATNVPHSTLQKKPPTPNAKDPAAGSTGTESTGTE